MIGLLVVTHGRLAEELVSAVCTIVGEVESLEAISIGWTVDVDESRRRMEEAVRRLDRGEGVLVLTDMFGGSPTNIALSLLEVGKVEVVTGVNLPMLIKCTNLRGEVSCAGAARRIAEQGRQAIQVASELLEGRRAGDEA